MPFKVDSVDKDGKPNKLYLSAELIAMVSIEISATDTKTFRCNFHVSSHRANNSKELQLKVSEREGRILEGRFRETKKLNEFGSQLFSLMKKNYLAVMPKLIEIPKPKDSHFNYGAYIERPEKSQVVLFNINPDGIPSMEIDKNGAISINLKKLFGEDSN